MSAPALERRSEDLERITQDAVLCRGLGRSYGDSSLPPPGVFEVVGTVLADRMLGFDPDSGVLRAEAGFSLADLNRLFLPRGWVTPVSPGTQFVTLGGMVASDVHGKNHHQQGCFGEHVTALRLRVADGRVVECSRQQEPDLFRATLGGMGLTGHILEVAFKLQKIPSPWIRFESQRIPDLEGFLQGLKQAGPSWPYTMGWIDCISRGKNLGRGILFKGRWAEANEAPKHPPPPRRKFAVPFRFPGWVLNRFTMRAFNELYYWRHISRWKTGIMHPDPFFYPLDAIHHWNRIYGARGFTQYQCVLPDPATARPFLELLTARGGASFLCVIEDCGAEGLGVLSFPRPGISIALDIPIRSGTQMLIDELNEFVIAKQGRIYLTKDGFTRPHHFRAMEPRLDEFLRIRQAWDQHAAIRSAQSVRMLGDGS
jgi:FAD/FMN-containing dehydrogenase